MPAMDQINYPNILTLVFVGIVVWGFGIPWEDGQTAVIALFLLIVAAWLVNVALNALWPMLGLGLTPF